MSSLSKESQRSIKDDSMIGTKKFFNALVIKE